MPEFIYNAKKDLDKTINGVVTAADQKNAIKTIIQWGLTPVDVFLKLQNENFKRSSKIYFSCHISRQDVLTFTGQMADAMGACVPLLHCFEIMIPQIKNLKFKALIEQVFIDVKNGRSLSEGLRPHSKIFSSFYIDMIQAGEQSARLDKVFKLLAGHLEKQKDLSNKIRSALAYPLLILITGLITIFILLTVVIPRIIFIFEDMHQPLPFVTIALLNLSHFFMRVWPMALLIIFLMSLYVKQFIHSASGRKKIDILKIQIPFWGDFLKQIELSRFCHALGLLLENRISAVNAFLSAQHIIQNEIFQEQIKEAIKQIQDGVSVTTALSRSSFFSAMARQIIAIGEETGALEQGFLKIAEILEKNLDNTAKTFVSLLAPGALLIIVFIVGIIVLAVLLPILQMNVILQ